MTSTTRSFQRTLAVAIACVTLVGVASAQPTMTVTPQGLNASNDREWLVEIAPDATLFSSPSGGSLATELAFEVVVGDILSATKFAADWPFDNPGNNPFTNQTDFGVQVDTAADTVFAALGSNVFTSGSPVDTLLLVTSGSGPTTINWGGHMLLVGSQFEYTGSRIAQDGVNYDSYIGSSSVVPEPSTAWLSLLALLAGSVSLRRSRR